MQRLWLVRAGRQGERENIALEKGIIAPGFTEIADLSKASEREDVANLLKEALPEATENKIKNFAAQLNQFKNTIQPGDLVVLPRKFSTSVAIGEVTGGYKYDSDESIRHSRPVKWLKTDLPRSAFKQDLLFSLGAFMTICEIQRNQALQRVQILLQTGKDPGADLGQGHTIPVKARVEDETVIDEYRIDLEEYVNQQIISRIISEFSGHSLAALVGEILKIQGYTVKVSPEGADGGKDILASDGPLGFGDKRICVQVKSGDVVADNKVVLGLQGAMANSKAVHGLLVCLGGITGPAQKVLDDNFFSIRLWQMRELLQALFETYEQLSNETKAKLQLKQIWIPIARDGIESN